MSKNFEYDQPIQPSGGCFLILIVFAMVAIGLFAAAYISDNDVTLVEKRTLFTSPRQEEVVKPDGRKEIRDIRQEYLIVTVEKDKKFYEFVIPSSKGYFHQGSSYPMRVFKDNHVPNIR